MMNRLAAQTEKWNWRARIERIRCGPSSVSCDHLAFYEDDDCFIRYRKAGKGPPIVFLCDGPATLEVYDELIATLSASYTIIAFETPGNGFSVPKPSYSFSFQKTNDVIARFLRSVAGEQSILAFSCGASYAAVDIANRYTELCSRLIILQAPSWQEELKWRKRRDPKGLISTPFVGQLIFPRMMKPRAPVWYELSMAKGPAVEHFCTCTAHAFDRGATFALPTMFQNYLVGEKAPFGVPEQATLVIWGEQDASHADTNKASSKSLARSARVVTLGHVGHFPELEDPAGFASLVAEFTANLA